MTNDPLRALLDLSVAEGGLDAASIERFQEALRARAERILAERVRPIEERAVAFERESQWRAGIMAGLEEEKVFAQAEISRLKSELGRVAALQLVSAQAHELLLAHHRDLLCRLAAELTPLPQALPWGYRRVRARLMEWIVLLRRDSA